ncbi:MAG: hypothetical protein J6K00_03100, partial [Oscillospiraceae bacterium]|nr:hypothetical protein [Oscillospiraceae bacterium]
LCHPPTIRVLNIRKALLLFHIQHLFALLYHVSSGLGWFKSAFTQGEGKGKAVTYRSILSEVVFQTGALHISAVQSLPLEGKVARRKRRAE